MDFLTEDRASAVQLISLPLELAGLALVLLEIHRPRLARLIEHRIEGTRVYLNQILPRLKWRARALADKLANWYLSGSTKESDPVDFAGGWMIAKVGVGLYVVHQLVKGTLSLEGFQQAVVSAGMFVIFGTLAVMMFLGMLLSCVTGSITVSVTATTRSIAFLNLLAKGRTVGAIGLILACLGVLGEAYQVAVLFAT